MRSKFFIDFLPEAHQSFILDLKKKESFHLRLTSPRKSKLGDYRYDVKSQQHFISINIDLEPFWFLITYVHEVAHKICFDRFKGKVPAHGKEWKSIYKELLQNIYHELEFSTEEKLKLIELIQTTPARFKLEHIIEEDQLLVKDLAENTVFELESGSVFKIIKKRRTRYLCHELPTNQPFLVAGLALVKKIID